MTSTIHAKRIAFAALVLAAVSGALVLGRMTARVDAEASPPAAIPVAAAAQVPALETAPGLRPSFHDVLAPALRAVVSVKSTRPVGRAAQRPDFPFPFPHIFPQPEEDDLAEPPRVEDHGSGVIVRADGIVLTNNHVVEGASEVIVTLPSGRELKAKIVGTDPPTDIAVLKVEPEGLPTLPLGRSSDLKVGDLVFAIGNPFDIGQTATMGIVSATGRHRLGIIREGYEDFIQTDAAINPGNSGGALIDARGMLVGINTAIYSQTRGNLGVGFAVPIDMAARVMAQLLEGGKVTRSWLGIQITEVTADVAKQVGLDEAEGALVVSVEEDTPAERAGLRAGDVIVTLDGERVPSDQQLRLTISSRPPGSRAKLGILRDGDRMTLDVLLEEKPAEAAARSGGEAEAAEGTLRGVAVKTLDAATRERLDLPRNLEGVLVTQVGSRTPAGRAGLHAGDVVVEVNRQAVTSASSFRAAAERVGDETALLRVRREDGEAIVVVRP